MRIGSVLGPVLATHRLPEMPPGALVEINLDDSNETIVAYDPLGCGESERVLVIQGSIAASWFAESNVVVDALVAGILDKKEPGK